jgi:hypothetical protein
LSGLERPEEALIPLFFAVRSKSRSPNWGKAEPRFLRGIFLLIRPQIIRLRVPHPIRVLCGQGGKARSHDTGPDQKRKRRFVLSPKLHGLENRRKQEYSRYWSPRAVAAPCCAGAA